VVPDLAFIPLIRHPLVAGQPVAHVITQVLTRREVVIWPLQYDPDYFGPEGIPRILGAPPAPMLSRRPLRCVTCWLLFPELLFEFL